MPRVMQILIWQWLKKQYILDAGFEGEGTSDKPFVPRMLTFQTATESKEGDKESSKQAMANLPLLSLIPIPTLGINNVDITFDMEVKSSFEENTSEKSDSHTSESGSLEARWVGDLFCNHQGQCVS